MRLKETTAKKRRLEVSREWLERAERVIPGCAQTFSKSPLAFIQEVAPNFVEKPAAVLFRMWMATGILISSPGLVPLRLDIVIPEFRRR